MKTLIALFAALLIIVLTVPVGATFLVSAPMPETVQQIQVDFGNGLIPDTVIVTLENFGDGTLRMHHDLAFLPESEMYSARARANYGVWGWSPWSDPFDFTKPSLGSPFGIGLSAD